MAYDDTYQPEPGEPEHAGSPTADFCERLALFGADRFSEPVSTTPPDPQAVDAALADLFDALVSPLTDTLLERDLSDLLWAQVNLFQRQVESLDRKLDANEAAQKTGQREQDGSEVKSTTLEDLLTSGRDLLERRDALETIRDRATDLYALHTGRPWRPRSGSLANRRTLTASIIDSRAFIAARRKADALTLAPDGARIAFTGGVNCDEHRAIWDALDRAHAKHPDMVLLHGGAPRGAERIAALWADQRHVAQVVFKPDWAAHNRAAPFKRNDALLEALPIGVIVFPGSGVSANLADKARRIGIPVWRFGGG